MNKENQSLTCEIDIFIQKQIKDVKSVDQINMSDFHVSKPNEFVDLSEAYRDLQILKKILQISMNLFNSFHLYADCDIIIKAADDGALTSYYRLDQHTSTWKCFHQPTLTDLRIALYNYILCFISIIKESAKKTITKCVMCDEDILEEEEQCSICDTYVHDIGPENMHHEKYKNNLEVDNKKENKSKNLDPSSLKFEYQNEKCGSDFLNLRKDFCRWKCGVCEYLNEYIINCAVCEGMYEDGKWLCGGCTKENSCGSDHCYKCGNVNVYVNVKGNSVEMHKQSRILNKVKYEKCGSMKEGLDKDVKMCTKRDEGDEVKIGKDQWKCGKCELLQYFDFINCVACSESREVNGLWKCDECTMINKVSNVRCGACDKEKFSLNMKYSQNCANKVSINKLNDCEFRKSDYKDQKENILDNGTSTSFRNHSERDEYIYKTKNEDKVKIGNDQWQCGKCELLQSFDMFVCKTCKINREVAGMWHCDKCGVVNECTNSNCKMCYESNVYLKMRYIDLEEKSIFDKFKNLFKEDNIEEEDHSGEWKCKYILCRKWSKVDSIYCQHCRLFRDHSDIQGDKVKKLSENGVENVWICFGCNNLNKFKNIKCSKYVCQKQRYPYTESSYL